MNPNQAAICRACEIVGGRAPLASHLSVTPAAVSQWCNGERRVPAERCPQIEKATGGKVRCEELRPDVAWDVLRMQAGQEPWDGVTERRRT
ncbi:MAG TPA: helix-turn-helix domain-containing protein [Ramlibacter sp.]|nr:helix-turn-helix domain-containing protein [Ramlibacter sp.]